jgi:hypothetical protein
MLGIVANKSDGRGGFFGKSDGSPKTADFRDPNVGVSIAPERVLKGLVDRPSVKLGRGGIPVANINTTVARGASDEMGKELITDIARTARWAVEASKQDSARATKETKSLNSQMVVTVSQRKGEDLETPFVDREKPTFTVPYRGVAQLAKFRVHNGRQGLRMPSLLEEDNSGPSVGHQSVKILSPIFQAADVPSKDFDRLGDGSGAARNLRTGMSGLTKAGPIAGFEEIATWAKIGQSRRSVAIRAGARVA